MRAQMRSGRIPIVLLSLLLAYAQASTAQAGVPQQPANGTTVDPSAPPQQPSASTASPASSPLPEAPQSQSEPSRSSTATQQLPLAERPLGAAAAGQIRTAGGSASRPAGEAIAPVKQRRSRSLAIKVGVVVASAVAVGAVVGLSRATPSTPSHSATASVK
jgi:hypothetical protein